jgi:regulator of protease activity HflC (stomatin/prohibitin superfamily)
MGRVQKIAGPGTLLVLPCVDKTIKIDVRTNTIHIPTLQIISCDKGIVELESAVFARVNDPVSAVCTLKEHENVRILRL